MLFDLLSYMFFCCAAKRRITLRRVLYPVLLRCVWYVLRMDKRIQWRAVLSVELCSALVLTTLLCECGMVIMQRSVVCGASWCWVRLFDVRHGDGVALRCHSLLQLCSRDLLSR